MIQSRCNFIISSFPNSEEKQNHLLSHIERIKEVGGYVTLITHFDCDIMIKDAVDFYLYNSNNEVSYKDSDLLQPILLGKATNFPSVNWVSFCDDDGDVVYGDYKAWIGYSPSIISLFIPALAMSFSGQFDYVVYMESDFIFPDNFDDKVNSICAQLENEGNDSLFFKVPEFPWFHGHLFFIKLTTDVQSKIPWGDYSTNSKFFSEFPNFIFEDFLYLIGDRINPMIRSRKGLNDFFDGDLGEKWDTHKYQWSMTDYMLYTTSLCSIFVDKSGKLPNRLFVHLKISSPFDSAKFFVRITGDNVLLEENYTLNRGGLAWNELNFLEPGGKYLFEFSISHKDIKVDDSYEIEGDQLENLSKFRNFHYL
jgi:hypothetical protein